MVLAGCCSQGWHGYLHALLKVHIVASPSLRHLSQAHQLLVTSLTDIAVYRKWKGLSSVYAVICNNQGALLALHSYNMRPNII